MKFQFFLMAVLLFCGAVVKAQWNTGTNNSANVYLSGKAAIGASEDDDNVVFKINGDGSLNNALMSNLFVLKGNGQSSLSFTDGTSNTSLLHSGDIFDILMDNNSVFKIDASLQKVASDLEFELFAGKMILNDAGIQMLDGTLDAKTANLSVLTTDGFTLNGNYSISGLNNEFSLELINDANPKFFIDNAGNIGIGVNSGLVSKLTVNGTINATEVKVTATVPGPDYVFESDYELMSLEDLEVYISKNKHLPEVPSAKQMDAEGINVSEMNLLLLKKVEELTLHLIENKKEIEKLKNQIDSLKASEQN